MNSIAKAVSRQFEQAEEAQALAVMQQMFTGKAASPAVAEIGGVATSPLAATLSPLAQLAVLYGIPQAGIATPPVAHQSTPPSSGSPAPPAQSTASKMALLFFSAAAASSTH